MSSESRKMAGILLLVLPLVMFGGMSILGEPAQVPITEEPRHRIVFGHQQFRIFDVNIPPGDTTLEHIHVNDFATVRISGSETRTQDRGQDWGDLRPVGVPGDVALNLYVGQPRTHRVQNLGKTMYRLIGVENLRQSGWSEGTAPSGPGPTLASESRAFRVYDVRPTSGGDSVSHVHALPTVAVLVSGEADGGADKPAVQLAQSGQWVFVLAGQSHTLRSAGGSAAHVVEIEVR